jgi:anti-sigma regulatory factor (Ser/Thr protein kinase)
MILNAFKKFRPKEALVLELPTRFNSATMNLFIGEVVGKQMATQCRLLMFDFTKCESIEAEGVVVLCNLIEFLKRRDVAVYFMGHKISTRVTRHLDNCHFFDQYLGHRVFESSATPQDVMPLMKIKGDGLTGYLYMKLMPWIASSVSLSDHALSGVRAALEEILHNVRDHSGVDAGCTFAQHLRRENEIRIAISDFGRGIPDLVRTVLPKLSDQEALKKACEEGFTTKSNVRNRGAGLPTLMRIVSQKNTGTVLLHSGNAQLSATQGAKGTKITARQAGGFYPGTLVQVILRTDTLQKLADDSELEPFEW